ncbi:CHAPERONE PROTEIN CLPD CHLOROPLASTIC [Salix purpurea]|uniref:CHAPERONE PROTEIN CLPD CHLOROPLASTIC n=1 Tax=Salix purpurea TaxID=77065 RepID=A0A9Q0Q1U4_SALPP|nr:CHAPERONE PROTEIN CLPD CHLOROPLASTIC [Salix purpurea]
MRAGGCTVQQALTADAASVIKQAVTLAKRRGHAQVTPLHVANTMLSASNGLLRTACLQSHSHPLQCKALELCFNVALNRLPASTSTPILSTHSLQFPSISNALVAAFKRAQAHQRRGSIENQQQPLLTVKVEIEQLIISILDDPSVSRVMREAGFSSTQVKSNVEQAVSLEICSQSAPAMSSKSKESNGLVLSQSPTSAQVGAKATVLDPIKNEDVMCVIENLVNRRRRSFAIVGESLASIEVLVKGVVDKVQKGDVPDALREVKFLTIPVSSFCHLSRVEVEHKLEDLKIHVRSYMGKGVVLNLGDLKLAIENRASSSSSEQGRCYFCPMEYMITELGKLACGVGENINGRFWLMGIATFQTYMKCKPGHPSGSGTVLGLHPLTIPAGSLRLSLISDSDLRCQSTSNKAENESSSWIIHEGGEDKQLNCCADCSAKFETEARGLPSSTCDSDSTTSGLPAWLRQYKHEKNVQNIDNQDSMSIKDLCRKWNSFCSSIHHQPYFSEKTLTFSSVSPSSSTSYDQQYPSFQQTRNEWPIVEPKQTLREQPFWLGTGTLNRCRIDEPSLKMYISEPKDYTKQLPFSSNPNSTPNSTSSSDVMEVEYLHKFKELNAENLKILSIALEKKVPWQKDIIPAIASTILQCRSGMIRRKGKVKNSEAKEETWLLFQGDDVKAKEKIAKELARLVFGSHDSFISVSLSSFSSTRADSTEDRRNKRSRDEQSCSYIERFSEAVSNNPRRVFLVEDVEQADYSSQIGFKRAIESGRITNSNGQEVGLSDAIIILSCESFSSRSRACSPPIKQRTDGSQEEENNGGSGAGAALMEDTTPCISLDLNISVHDDSILEDQSIDDIGLLESVDGRIVFKVQEF